MNSYDETHLLMCEKEELVKYILESRERDEEAMKLSMSQNERFMDQLESRDTFIQVQKEEIRKCYIENKSLTAELELADFEIHRLEGELEETHEVCCDITHHADYETTFDDIRLLEEELEETYKEIRELKGENKELKERVWYLERVEYLNRKEEAEDICKDIIKTIVDGVVGP